MYDTDTSTSEAAAAAQIGADQQAAGYTPPPAPEIDPDTIPF